MAPYARSSETDTGIGSPSEATLAADPLVEPNVLPTPPDAMTIQPEPSSIYSEESRWDTKVESPEIASTHRLKAEIPDSSNLVVREYGGIGRLGYFLSMCGLAIVNSLASPSRSSIDDSSPISSLIVFAIALTLVGFRLKNIGISFWWALLAIIPLVNLWIGYMCLSQQEGYVETNELDGPGKIVRFIYIVFLAFVGIVIVAAVCGRA